MKTRAKTRDYIVVNLFRRGLQRINRNVMIINASNLAIEDSAFDVKMFSDPFGKIGKPPKTFQFLEINFPWPASM